MTITTNDLGLAAHIKSKGYTLIGCNERTFSFDSGVSGEVEVMQVKSELEISYANSCCRQHDSNVMYLRSMIKPLNRMKGQQNGPAN